MMLRTTLPMMIALFTLAGPARAADLGSPESKKAGTALVVTGVAIQLGGIGFATASLFDDEIAATIPRLIYHGVTVPFAALTVLGFERLLADGTEGGRFRALGVGFLQGAAYAGIVAGLSFLEMAVGPTPGGGYESTDVGSIFSFGYGLTHLPVMVGLLIPGIICAVRGTTGPSADRTPILVTPWDDGHARGLAIVGRF